MSNLNKTLGLDQIGLNNVSKIHRNLNVDNLGDEILKNNEGVISSTGAPIVDTGKFTEDHLKISTLSMNPHLIHKFGGVKLIKKLMKKFLMSFSQR